MMNIKGKFISVIQKRITISVIVIIVLCVVVAITLLLSNHISPLEKIKMKDVSEEYASYFEFIDHKNANGIDEYIVYTSYYFFNQYDIRNVSAQDVHDFTLRVFHVDLSLDKIKKVGDGPLLEEAHVRKDGEIGDFLYELDTVSQTDIATIKIYKYIPVSIRKKLSGKYVVVYDKYVVENPYDILNYYNDNGINQFNYNTNHIYNYLVGSGKIIDIKKACVVDLLKQKGKKKGKLKVTYQVQDSYVSIVKMK